MRMRAPSVGSSGCFPDVRGHAWTGAEADRIFGFRSPELDRDFSPQAAQAARTGIGFGS